MCEGSDAVPVIANQRGSLHPFGQLLSTVTATTSAAAGDFV
jgi:hypothetical protein